MSRAQHTRMQVTLMEKAPSCIFCTKCKKTMHVVFSHLYPKTVERILMIFGTGYLKEM